MKTCNRSSLRTDVSFLRASALGAASLLSLRQERPRTEPGHRQIAEKDHAEDGDHHGRNLSLCRRFRFWKKLIEERTGGDVDVQIFHTAQLGDERTINEGILAGAIQIGVGAGAWAGFVPAYNVVELPFLIRDMKHMYSLADGAAGPEDRRAGRDAVASRYWPTTARARSISRPARRRSRASPISKA